MRSRQWLRPLLVLALVVAAIGCTRGPRDVPELHTLATDRAMAVKPDGADLSDSRDEFACRGRSYGDLPTLTRGYTVTESRAAAFDDVRRQLRALGWDEVPAGPNHQDVTASMIFTRS